MTLSIGIKKLNKAFSLIEILLVVLILGIVMAVALPNFNHSHQQLSLSQSSQELINVSRWAQAMAMADRSVYVIYLSEDGRGYTLEKEIPLQEGEISARLEPVKGVKGRHRVFPEPVQLITQQNMIHFYPDATIEAAEILIKSGQRQVTLSSKVQRGTLVVIDE